MIVRLPRFQRKPLEGLALTPNPNGGWYGSCIVNGQRTERYYTNRGPYAAERGLRRMLRSNARRLKRRQAAEETMPVDRERLRHLR